MTESNFEFDLGPLSWVHREIDQALTRGLESLARFKAGPGDTAALKHARTHIHQAAGAIQMVGMDAVVAYTDEIERQLARLEDPATADAAAGCDAVDRACQKLKIYLDELVNGAPPVPLKLFPEFDAMQRVRGIRAASPTDLFYPDLAPRAPKLSAPQAIPPNKLPSFMVKQRRLYQHGLLSLMRGEEEGARSMRDAITAIESVTTHANLRAFWWTAGALFDAVTERGLESGFGVKQLAARIDLQIRRMVEGSTKVSDRLRREVLYYVAISAPVAPSVQAVQKGFRLAGLIPTAEVLNADLVRIQPHLREAREQLAGAKDTWLKVASGRAENMPKLKQTLAAVHKHAAEIGNGALMKLTAELVARLDKMPASGNVAEPLAMEYATGMLLAESAVENYANLSAEFPKQVEAMLARLDAAQMSRPAPAAAGAMLDEMSKRAQERVLLAQVGREIQANLRHMEQVLDAFFRDHAKRGELTALAKDSRQIRGALTILGLDDADRLLGLCQEQIEAYANPETPVDNDDLELLAESLSGLGFYVEAVEQQRPDRERLIAPLLAKRLGETPAPVVEAPDTTEAAVAELRAALPALVEEVHRAPADVAVRDALKAKLAGLKDDAELIGDADLIAQVGAALAELETGGTAGLAAAVEAIADTAAPAPEISAETQRLLATDATGLDAELLEIFLEEAAEVLDSIAEQRRRLEGNHGDRESLRTARRGFHTLKGSGRMVGLTDLGELAYHVEKIHNRLLEEDRPVTSTVVAMVDVAERNFRQWVEALSATGRVTIDPGELHAAILAVEAQLPGNRDSVLKPVPAVPSGESGAVAAVAVEGMPSVPPSAEGPAEPIAPLRLVPAAELAAEVAGPMPEPASEPVFEPVLELVGSVPWEPAATDLVAPAPAPAELAELGSPATTDVPHVVPLIEVPDFEGPDAGEAIDVALPSVESALDAFESIESNEISAVREAHAASPLHDMHDVPAHDEAQHAPDVHDTREVQGDDHARHETAPAADLAYEPHAVLEPAVAESVPTETELGIATLTPPLVEPESEASEPPPVAAATEPVSEPDELTIGDVTLSTVLYSILVEEADLHLATLAHEMSVLQFDPHQRPSPEMIRASHTLCGIHRTGGFPLIASTAKLLEQCLLALQQRDAAMPGAAHPVLARAVAGLHGLVGRLKARQAFTPGDTIEAGEIQQELDTLRQELMAEVGPADAEAQAERDAVADEHAEVDVPPMHLVEPPATAVAEELPVETPVAVAPIAPPSLVPAATVPTAAADAGETTLPHAIDPLAEVRDDIDATVLPIFLEEAAELYPRAGEQLRAWRRSPQDDTSASELRRTLHTFKGSARMAGAMRLGELAHLMESRLMAGDVPARGTPALFDALDADLDHIAFVLDALREGRTDVPLPWVAEAQAAAVAAAAEAGVELPEEIAADLVEMLPVAPAPVVEIRVEPEPQDEHATPAAGAPALVVPLPVAPAAAPAPSLATARAETAEAET
ncbi:MAG: hypothetical protein EHM83_04250, partial [Burkholderiales bacterium]